MRIIPMEHRDIITGSTDPDPQAEIEPFIWKSSFSILLPLFMSLLLGFSSCHDEDLPNPPERELVPASFSVEIEGDAETRLSFVDNDTKLDFHFETGDKIKLYDGCSTSHVLTYNADEAKFKGSVCSNRSDTEYSAFRAVYPASSSTSSYNEVLINATQTVNAGSFDKASAPMIANYNHEQNKLFFKPAFSLLKITVPEEYSKIVVTNYSSPNKNYYLTGTATLAYDGTNVQVSKKDNDGKSSVTLNPASGLGDTYYMCIFPCILSGLQVACYKGDKISFRCNAGFNMEIARTDGLRLGNVADLNWATCEAINIGCIFTGQNVNYYIADRNLGITDSSPLGAEYSQGEAAPSEVWGPGWSLPNVNTLNYWAKSAKNGVGNYVNSSFYEDKEEYSLAKDNAPGTIWVSLPVPSFEGNYIGNYWGADDNYLYISKLETEQLSTAINQNNSDETAYIRPVFTVPVP